MNAFKRLRRRQNTARQFVTLTDRIQLWKVNIMESILQMFVVEIYDLILTNLVIVCDV